MIPATEHMRIFKLFGTAGAAALLAATVSMPVHAAAEMANPQLKDSSGKAVGDVDLTQTPAGVLIKLQIKGLPPGEHAFHVHAVGKCEAPFESAGPHFNPGNHKHGILSGEAHAGDMPTSMCRRAASFQSRSSTRRSRWRRAGRTRCSTMMARRS